VWFDIGLILFLVFMNGLFAMAEIAIVSARRVRLQQLADKGSKGAAKALELGEQPGRFLSTIQVGITSIGILSGALGERIIADQLRDYFSTVPELADYARELSLTIMVVTITYVSLIIGELVPKRLALLRPEPIAAFFSRPMHLLSVVALPLVKLLSVSSDLALRALGVTPPDEPSVTEEEIKVLLEQATVEGVFERTEQQLVENILRLDDRKVGAIMTPRKDIVYLDARKPFERNRQTIMEHPHWILPLCNDGLDNLIGFVKTKDLLNRMLSGEKADLIELITPALFVPNSLSLMQVLEQFKKSHLHTALVVDEYGELDGLVSLSDILEAIVGDIPSDANDEEPQIVRREDGSWLVDGMLDIDRLKELFDLNHLPEEQMGNFHTVGGFVMLRLGNVPRVTDCFEFEGLRFEVIDMDRNRVDKVLITNVAGSAD
jgi:putative hemolysin